MAKCLVLGANGFIGSHVVDVLLEQGHKVRCFDRYKANTPMLNSKDHSNIEIFAGDFLNYASLNEALDDIDYVFHFISTTTPITSEEDPVIDIETNIRMSVELFKLCVNHKIKRVIFASTGGAIYGDQDDSRLLSEELYPRPISPYAIGKLTIENYLRYFYKKHGLENLILRISNPYGPRQNPLSKQGVIPIFLDRIYSGEPITIFGDGSMVRDYIYVGDVAKMVALCFDSKNNSSRVYNIGSGEGYSINDLIKNIEQVVNKKITIHHTPVPSTFVKKVVLDTTRFNKDFGKISHIPLLDGIKLTWQELSG